jgi:hypothetical protein
MMVTGQWIEIGNKKYCVVKHADCFVVKVYVNGEWVNEYMFPTAIGESIADIYQT